MRILPVNNTLDFYGASRLLDQTPVSYQPPPVFGRFAEDGYQAPAAFFARKKHVWQVRELPH